MIDFSKSFQIVHANIGTSKNMWAPAFGTI